jgi:hypothetical protein
MTAVIAQDEKLLMDYYEKLEIVPEKRNNQHPLSNSF